MMWAKDIIRTVLNVVGSCTGMVIGIVLIAYVKSTPMKMIMMELLKANRFQYVVQSSTAASVMEAAVLFHCHIRGEMWFFSKVVCQ